MIPKSRSLVPDRLNAENIEKVHDRHLFDFIDVHRLTVLVDDELHADAKLRVEMSRAVAKTSLSLTEAVKAIASDRYISVSNATAPP